MRYDLLWNGNDTPHQMLMFPDHTLRHKQISSIRKMVLVNLFSMEHILRLRLHSWASESASGGGSSSNGDDSSSGELSVKELFKSTTDAIWGEEGMGSERAKLWQNWDVMLFWLDVLQVSA